jgi:hypothetical protein
MPEPCGRQQRMLIFAEISAENQSQPAKQQPASSRYLELDIQTELSL